MRTSAHTRMIMLMNVQDRSDSSNIWGQKQGPFLTHLYHCSGAQWAVCRQKLKR